jgi:FkbM family methyltransferase
LGILKSVKRTIPTAKLYGFEAFDYWHAGNEETAFKEDIHYFKGAVSDIDGTIMFNPSLTQHEKDHPFSGSIFKPLDHHLEFHQQVYGEPLLISSIRLETFCKEFNVTPDFIHIDTEGAEFKIFQNIGEYKPKCVWSEICGFQVYDTHTSFDDFDLLMTTLGYYKVYSDNSDALYCQLGFEITPYTPTKRS